MSTALLVFAVAISLCFQLSARILTSMTPSPEITESSVEKTLFSLAPDSVVFVDDYDDEIISLTPFFFMTITRR